MKIEWSTIPFLDSTTKFTMHTEFLGLDVDVLLDLEAATGDLIARLANEVTGRTLVVKHVEIRAETILEAQLKSMTEIEIGLRKHIDHVLLIKRTLNEARNELYRGGLSV